MIPQLYTPLIRIGISVTIALGIFAYGYYKGFDARDTQAKLELLAAKEKVIKQVETQTIVNDRVVTKYIDKIVEIEKYTPILIEEIKKEIPNEINDSCKLPVSVIRLYDSSNRLQAAGTPASTDGTTN
jgi:hypothetical protein